MSEKQHILVLSHEPTFEMISHANFYYTSEQDESGQAIIEEHKNRYGPDGTVDPGLLAFFFKLR